MTTQSPLNVIEVTFSPNTGRVGIMLDSCPFTEDANGISVLSPNLTPPEELPLHPALGITLKCLIDDRTITSAAVYTAGDIEDRHDGVFLRLLINGNARERFDPGSHVARFYNAVISCINALRVFANTGEPHMASYATQAAALQSGDELPKRVPFNAAQAQVQRDIEQAFAAAITAALAM